MLIKKLDEKTKEGKEQEESFGIELLYE
jgi:hypothetical protein